MPSIRVIVAYAICSRQQAPSYNDTSWDDSIRNIKEQQNRRIAFWLIRSDAPKNEI